MKPITITIPRPFPECRAFLADDLPEIIFKNSMESKLGGKTFYKALNFEKQSHSKLLVDSPARLRVSVFLGKPSNRLLHGYVRALVEASEEGDTTVVRLSDIRNGCFFVGLRFLGFLFFIVPGLFLLVIDQIWSGHHRKVLRKSAAEVREKYPDATISE